MKKKKVTPKGENVLQQLSNICAPKSKPYITIEELKKILNNHKFRMPIDTAVVQPLDIYKAAAKIAKERVK